MKKRLEDDKLELALLRAGLHHQITREKAFIKEVEAKLQEKPDFDYPHHEDLLDLFLHFQKVDEESGYIHPDIPDKNSTSGNQSTQTDTQPQEYGSVHSKTNESSEVPVLNRVHSLEKLVYKLLHFLLQANQSIYELQIENAHLRQHLHLPSNGEIPSGFTNTVYGIRRHPIRNQYIKPELTDQDLVKTTPPNGVVGQVKSGDEDQGMWVFAADRRDLEGHSSEDDYYTDKKPGHVPNGITPTNSPSKLDQAALVHNDNQGPIETIGGQIILGPLNYIDKPEKRKSST